MKSITPLKVMVVANSLDREKAERMGMTLPDEIVAPSEVMFDLSIIGNYARNCPNLTEEQVALIDDEWALADSARLYGVDGDYLFSTEMSFSEFDLLYKEWKKSQEVEVLCVGDYVNGSKVCVSFDTVYAIVEHENNAGILKIFSIGEDTPTLMYGDFHSTVEAFRKFKKHQHSIS